MPTLCMVHEGIGNYSAIARVAASGVRQALAAGWRVTVVAERLDESLAKQVEWLKLYVPRKVFAVKWLVARSAIRAAMGGRTFDVVHVHQPQVASLADVMQCHYLTRAAYEYDCLEQGDTLRSRLTRLQELVVLRAEDYYFRRWNPATHMLFDSALTQSEFNRMYGPPAKQDVLLYPFPPARIPSAGERLEARRKMVGERQGTVVGYLGGIQERKGYRRLVEAVKADPGLVLLMGGQYTDAFTDADLGDRLVTRGLVDDLATFYAACDVFAIPSRFEPFGLVAFEAAARGVPVIGTAEVGALPHLAEFGAGRTWDPGTPLGNVAREMAADRDRCAAIAGRLEDEYCEGSYGHRLLAVYDKVLRLKKRASAPILAAE
ncbi:MAG: glycosyltransferase family 4 protein [Capsulimonadaceae bacterium]|nr:glycosyltransferase family 4 protein [Capsulimonadaceae bacterium]